MPGIHIDTTALIPLFEQASARSIAQVFQRGILIADSESTAGLGRRTHQSINIARTPLHRTVKHSRILAYDRAHDRSWPRLQQALSTAPDDRTAPIEVAAIFRPHIHPLSRHDVNWLAIDDAASVDARLQDTETQRIDDALRDSRHQFEALDLCQWHRPYAFINGAILRCHLDELKNLVEQRPDFIAGLYIEPTIRPGGGDAFRADPASGLTRYLDVSSDQAHTGAVPSPLTGHHEITVAYADPKGFYEVDRHPAFFESTATCIGRFCTPRSRVRAMQRCDSEGCWHDRQQGQPASHGARIIGGFQSLLGDQARPPISSGTRQARSYAAYDAGLMLYDTDNSATATVSALEDASRLRQGRPSADIWAYSASSRGCDDPRGRYMPWTMIVDTAYDRGVIATQITGNSVDRWRSRCTTTGLATRSDSLVVGAFGHTDQAPMADWDYSSQPLSWASVTDLEADDRCPDTQLAWNDDGCYSSAEGGADLMVDNQLRPRARSVVDLVAPAGRRYSALRSATGKNEYRSVCCGSSHAAPMVAAAVVSLRDWGYQRQLSIYDNPTLIYTLMLFSGDFSGEWTSRHRTEPLDQQAPSPDRHYALRRGFSRIWGAGRLRAQRLSGEGATLRPPTLWDTGSLVLDDQHSHWRRIGRRPIPESTREITALFAWDEPGLSAHPDDPAAQIIIELRTAPPGADDRCPRVPEYEYSTIGVDHFFDTKKRIAIGPELIEKHPQIIGHCLYLHIDTATSPGPRQAGYFVVRSR